MLKIGYVRLRDPRAAEDTATLKAAGCHVVRAEEANCLAGCEHAVLKSILDFISEGDRLVVTRLSHLHAHAHEVLELLSRLEARGAGLIITESHIATDGEGARALHAALVAVAELETAWAPRRHRSAPAEDILALQAAGVGPVEIARRLGVSRMTVWRRLKDTDT